MQQFVGTSLKTRLYLMVLAAFIPVAVLIFYIAEEQQNIEKGAILQKTLLLAQAVASGENQQLEAIRNLLAALADAFLSVSMHGGQLPDLWQHLLRQSKGYAAFGFIDPGGHLMAGSAPSETGWDFGQKTWFLSCINRKELAMGRYHGEHIAGEPVLYFGLPVINNQNQIAAVVFAALNLNWMNRTIFKQLADLPMGSRLTMLDQTEGMLRYDVNTRRWSVLNDFSLRLSREMVARRSGTLSAADENGVLRIFAFAPMTSFFRNRHITAVLEIPQKVALAATRRIFIRNTVLLLVSALLAMVAIWWAGEVFILRRIGAMVHATRRLAGGDLGARIGKIGVKDELSHLAGVFDEMAASLQTRIERETEVMASLEKSREQLRRLAAYQQEVREQERIRIAREIHDQLGQSITVLKMDLTWLKKHLQDKPPAVNEKMETMSQVIDEALKSLHGVTAELRPVILDDFGLAAALEWQMEAFSKRSGMDCRLENNGYEPDLPKDQATALFRIFQETLTNILRHSRADQVVVRLEPDEGELMLQVQDNGRGIKASEIEDPKSFGLLGMRERLYPWGGRVLIEGRPGQGTRVTVRLSMPPSQVSSPKGEPT